MLRITICFILSILIGIERQYRHKTVGLRTNVLVSLGAFMFVSASFYVVDSDTTRIAAQVVSGIGFFGAGVILRGGNRIKGLNTAATLWCVSSIGVLTDFGMLKEAAIETLFILISNIILRLVSHKIMDKIKTQENCIINIICDKVNLKISIISNDKFYFDEIAKHITASSNIDSIYVEHSKLIKSNNEDIDE